MKISFPSNQLYLLLTDQEPGLRLKESEMPALPQSILSTTRSSSVPAFTTPINLTFIREKSLETDFEIRGTQTLQVRVNRLGRR